VIEKNIQQMKRFNKYNIKKIKKVFQRLNNQKEKLIWISINDRIIKEWRMKNKNQNKIEKQLQLENIF
jgi:DNA-directed RNA polymerase subunit H (RpoH/RPB5)